MKSNYKNKLSQNWLLILIVLGMLIVRLLWFETTISRDEGGFGFIAMMWLRGVAPTFWLNVHGPMLYSFYALSIFLFGDSILPIRVLNDSLFVLSIILVYLLASKWFGKRTGLLSAFFFGFSMNVPILEGMNALGEQLSIPFVLLALYLCTRGGDKNWEYIFLCGVAISIASLTKITSFVGIVVICVALFLRRAKQNSRFLANSIVPLALGTIVPIMVFVVYFASQNNVGGLVNLYFRTFSFGSTASDVPVYIKFMISVQNLPVWAFSAVGVFFAVKSRSKNHLMVLVWALLFFAVALIPPTFGHRFDLLLPPASILASIGVIYFARSSSGLISRRFSAGPQNKKAIYFASALLVVILFVPSFYFQSMQYPQMNLNSGGMVWNYADSDYETQIQVSHYLSSHMSANDSLFVHGWSAEIYWLAGKSSPSPYVWSTGLLPQSEQIKIENLIKSTSFEKVVLFSNSMDDLFVRANFGDPIIRDILYYYSFDTQIGNAFVFSKHSGTGLIVTYSLLASFNDSYKYCDLGNGTLIETANLQNKVYMPKAFVIAHPYKYVIGQVPLAPVPNVTTKSYISYSVHVLPNSSLQFRVGIDPVFWDRANDVRFQVFVDNGTGNIAIFDKILDPKNGSPNLIEKSNIDLSDFADKNVNITFATSPGLSNTNAYDFAFWENPVIVTND
jgi:hypothetical protein